MLNEPLDPAPHSLLQIGGVSYYFTEVPNVHGIVYAELGRKATVYRLFSSSKNQYFALKVFKPAYQSPRLVKVCNLLTHYKYLSGLEAADCTVIAPNAFPELTRKYSELAFAILMRWIHKEAWINIIANQTYIDSVAIRKTATQFCRILINLEQHHLAHSDISGSNVLVNYEDASISLIGLDNMYGPEFPRPDYFPAGSTGYAHPHAREVGQWNAQGDRFAGAIILSEMLVWSDKEIREVAAGESYFSDDEVGHYSQRYKLLVSKLKEINPSLSQLFSQAWFSKNLESCPSLSSWAEALPYIP